MNSRTAKLAAFLVALVVVSVWPAFGQDTEHKSTNSDNGYVIGAEDVLAINVWKEAELSRTVPVRPDGMISLPLVNDVKAAGLTPIQLAASITEKLRKFVTDPQVTVIVQTINSKKVHLMGEIGRAGTFALLPEMTVLQALAGAGGFSQYAKKSKIYILRMGEDGKQIKIPFNYDEVIKGKKPEQNILLKSGDTIVVP